MVYFTIFLGFVLGILVFLYDLGRKQNKYFEENGIPFIPFHIPIVGNMWDYVTMKKHCTDIIKGFYDQFPNKRFFGSYQFTRPVLLIKDLELIKNITIRDFDSFPDHMCFVDEINDKIFGNGLFQLKGQKWKDMRSTLSPAFTSSKMRHMFSLVHECAKNSTDHFIKEMEKSQNRDCGYLHVEMKNVATRFTNDTIASSAFGISVNSFGEPDNLFYKMGRKLTNFSTLISLKILFITIMPRITKYLKVGILHKTSSNFFFNLITETMHVRKNNDVFRPDVIHLLNETKKGTLKREKPSNGKDEGFATVEESAIGQAVVKREFSHLELVSPVIIFFFAGVETTSTLVCFMAYELATHPDIQRKLQEEIDEVASRNDGKLQYEDLQHMKYMDMVTSESLRLWPPVFAIDRRCVKPYKLPPADDNTDIKFTIPVNNIIQIPVYAIHRDPKHFPDPEVFDPERFSSENRKNIKSSSYLPFGIGPRNCIGSRLALLEVKTLMFYLLLNFDFITTPKSEVPIQFVRSSFNYTTKNGINLGLKPRKIKSV